MEVGQYGVGAFLRFVENFNYVLYNQATGEEQEEQGEMDIIGIRDADRVVFVCEAAFHLRGLTIRFIELCRFWSRVFKLRVSTSRAEL